ncbi:MAG: hypothetical protein WCI31_09260 [Prolixibacteraceae bacterium]
MNAKIIKLIFLSTIFFVSMNCVNIKAQEQKGGSPLFSAYYRDTLNTKCNKTYEGNYYKELSFQVKKGDRMAISFRVGGNDKNELNLTMAGKSEAIFKKVGSLSQEGNSIFMDTTFVADNECQIRLTTVNPGKIFRYSAVVFIATPEAIAFRKDADICWKLAYFLKHSPCGFNFLNSKRDMYSKEDFYSNAQLSEENGTSSIIHIGKYDIFLNCYLGRGLLEQTNAAFNQTESALRQCFGDKFDYTFTAEKGLKSLTCTYFADKKEQPIVRRTASNIPVKGEKMAIFVVTLSMDIDKGSTISALLDPSNNKITYFSLYLKIENPFYQFN